MGSYNSLDEHVLIAALLCDVQTLHGSVFNTRSLRLTLNKVKNRFSSEGIGFLTKTLPRLGKAFDKALSEQTKLTAATHGFKTMRGSELPRFLGEFFSRVFHPDGTVLQDPCVLSVGVLRQILYLFYKYETPYSSDQEQTVVTKFERTEDDLTVSDSHLTEMYDSYRSFGQYSKRGSKTPQISVLIIREARSLLREVFKSFDPLDIKPRHGPGVVSTKERLWSKYSWSNVPDRITSLYPLDAYFYVSLGHVCDRLQEISLLTSNDQSAKVLLVPKDSRGPRLISCEPLSNMWIQQGLGRAIVSHVENLELTKFNVFFTDQGPNRRGAQLGSSTGKYATLDLNEASDRVSLELVRLLFPGHICDYLEACRSLTTVLPSGKILKLKKFAPMGSALCFPILALTTWAILTAGAPDTDTRDGILVYGDDVIVPTAHAANAIEQLESFGLKVNRDKSCTSGLFRESCGMDAFKGVDVTPVRFRTVWSSDPSPEMLESWVAYANSMFKRSYCTVYEKIVEALVRIYGPLPGKDMLLSCPSLEYVPDHARPRKKRWNKTLQRIEYRVIVTKATSIQQHIDGWSELLRYSTEGPGQTLDEGRREEFIRSRDLMDRLPLDMLLRWSGAHSQSYTEPEAFSVGLYTKRRASILTHRWRSSFTQVKALT